MRKRVVMDAKFHIMITLLKALFLKWINKKYNSSYTGEKMIKKFKKNLISHLKERQKNKIKLTRVKDRQLCKTV